MRTHSSRSIFSKNRQFYKKNEKKLKRNDFNRIKSIPLIKKKNRNLLTLASAWKALSVNCEHPATSNVDNNVHCVANAINAASVNAEQPDKPK